MSLSMRFIPHFTLYSSHGMAGCSDPSFQTFKKVIRYFHKGPT